MRRNVSRGAIIAPSLALVRQPLAGGKHPCPRTTFNKPTKTQQRATKMIGACSTGLGNKLRKLGLLHWARGGEGQSTACSDLKDSYKDDGATAL